MSSHDVGFETAFGLVLELSANLDSLKGGQGCRTFLPLSGLSGLSFDSPFLSLLSWFFCLVLLLFLSCHFSASGPFSRLFSRKFWNRFRKLGFFVWLVEQLGDCGWYVQLADMWRWYLWWCIYVALRSNYCYYCIKSSLNITSDEVTSTKPVTVYSATVTEWARFQRERKMDGFTRTVCGLNLNSRWNNKNSAWFKSEQ